MTPPATRLSKSRFVAGCQCHKLLWWKVHEPLAVELQLNRVLEDRLDQGRRVGAGARSRASAKGEETGRMREPSEVAHSSPQDGQIW